jgi:hypothetical protein
MNQTLAPTTLFTSWVKRCTAAGLPNCRIKAELRLTAGATSPQQQVIVLRELSRVNEPAVQLLRQV